MFYNQIVKYFREELEMPIASSWQLMKAMGGEGRAMEYLIDKYCEETGADKNDLEGGIQHRTDVDMTKNTKWITLRRKALKIFGKECMKCGEFGDQVDHIHPRSKYPDLAYDTNNIQILCGQCNKIKGEHDETDYRTEDHIRLSKLI